MNLTEDQIKLYNDHGYLVIQNFFSESHCEYIKLEARNLAQGHYVNILNPHLRNEYFFRLLVDQEILSIADQLQGCKMIPISSIFFFCKPDNPLEMGSNFHQDNYAAKAPYGSYFICGVAFDDTDESNGALIVYPGTHKLRELENIPSKNFEFDKDGKISKAYAIGNKVEVPIGFQKVQLRYQKGSLIFLHGHIIHGAPKNPSKDKWRHKAYLHYIKDGDPFWPGWTSRRQLINRDLGFNEFRKLIDIH